MRDYSKISPKFWTGRTGKEIRKLGTSAQLVALYLLTSPHANMLGLYHLPALYIAADTGLSQDAVSCALEELVNAMFCAYDRDAEMVWVYEMARYQCLDSGCDRLKPSDNRVKAIRRELAALPATPLQAAFVEKYGATLSLNITSPVRHAPPSQAPCKAPCHGLQAPFPSQEQEQEQEQEQDSLSHTSGNAQERETRTNRPMPEIETRGPDILVGEEANRAAITARLAGSPEDDPDTEFLEIVEAYPRKDPPLEAWPTWKSLKRRRRLPVGGVNAVIDAVHAWNVTDEWRRDNGRFVPKLKKFLADEFFTITPRASPSSLPKLNEARAFVAKYGKDALKTFCANYNLDISAYVAALGAAHDEA